MRHHFIQKHNLPNLTVFFAGWGMDEHPFADYHPQDCDLLLCYDYRTLDFDRTLLDGYRNVRLVAWSMGVWAASRVFHNAPAALRESIAFNGTPTPVDNERGIPGAIFNGTLQNLCDATLHKFFRRMCGSPAAFTDFLAQRPQRPVGELKEELACIGTMAGGPHPREWRWDKAVIGNKDLIFSAANQQRAWQDSGTAVVMTDCPHYDGEWLRRLVCNPSDAWTKE